jgi:hypothetical protein
VACGGLLLMETPFSEAELDKKSSFELGNDPAYSDIAR